jgi:hypothetical protein
MTARRSFSTKHYMLPVNHYVAPIVFLLDTNIAKYQDVPLGGRLAYIGG